MAKITIIGLGRVGTALGILLSKVGHQIVSAFDIDPDARVRFAEALNTNVAGRLDEAVLGPDVILISVPDRAIEDVSHAISCSQDLMQGVYIGHTSGALSSRSLHHVKAEGCPTFSMHPIQTFASVESAVKAMPRSYFGIEGDPEALRLAEEIITSIGGKPLLINPDLKPLYHTALCVASNFLVTLLDMAVKLGQGAGIEKKRALEVMLPLIETTISNFEQSGTRALTGPIERGDADTVKRQLKVVETLEPKMIPVYLALAKATVSIAQEMGSITVDEAKLFLQTLESVDKQSLEE